jgi:alkanesulfonate monooxygenase SsuD/methylene tetrahydromethanopterin reductase-like flavin-dependent oxidoreductase (luciferase family)
MAIEYIPGLAGKSHDGRWFVDVRKSPNGYSVTRVSLTSRNPNMTIFGLYAAIGDPPRGERLRQCIDEVCAEAQLAEQVGFDAILVGEHHQHRDGFLPSPLIVSTAVAARTQKIRIGTGILLLPLYHPVHVAEDAATLDIIANGRLILGVGMGYQAGDFGAFGIPPGQRVSRLEGH